MPSKKSKGRLKFDREFIGPPTLAYFRSVHYELYNEYVKPFLLKTCSGCGLTHPHREYKNSGNSVRSTCRTCDKEVRTKSKSIRYKKFKSEFVGPPTFWQYQARIGYVDVSKRRFKEVYVGPKTKHEVAMLVPEVALANKKARMAKKKLKERLDIRQGYSKTLLSKCGGIKYSEVTPELIQIHRENLLLKRELRKFNSTIKEMQK